MRSLLLLAAIFFFLKAYAQPSEAEIRKQITNEGTKSIKFTYATGTRQWNKDIGNWEWVRGVEITRKSDYPGIDLLVVGDVVYQYTGAGKYSYWKFRVYSNQYFGIPNPSATEINDLLSKDWAKYYGFYFQKITTLHEPPALATDPKWLWHTPNSVEFRMQYKADIIASNTTIETRLFNCKVRLYRDDAKAIWKSVLNMADNNQLLETKTYTVGQIREMEKKTLAYTLNEQLAKEKKGSLPEVRVPEFASFNEMVIFLHTILREGTAEQFQAALMKVLSPRFFIPGSTVQLNQQGADMINNAVNKAFKGDALYKDQYCKNFQVNKSLSSAKYAYVLGAINNVTTVFGGEQFNEGYIEGVPQKKWKLNELRVGVRQDQDAINFVKSFSDRSKLCPVD